LRVLARHGLVQPDSSTDGRERPWRAVVTGFSIDDAAPGTSQARGGAALRAAALQLDQRLAREYLARRDQVPPRWRAVDAYDHYALRVTPAELRQLLTEVDRLIRPLIAATRGDVGPDAAVVHLSLQAFLRDVSQ
jgi:hypothetical protein